MRRDLVKSLFFKIFLLTFFSWLPGASHFIFPQGLELTIHGVDESAGNVSCYIVKTPLAVYFLEKRGLGLSSMVGRDGHDWISFHPRSGSGPGGEYRGFPNAVHKQDGSFFHPKNEETDSSLSEIKYAGAERITIAGKSGNKAWECRWDFYPDHCTFTMTKMSVGYKYWVLYEGTSGGEYDDSDWWMTSDVSEKRPLTSTHEGDIPNPEWIVFGDKSLKRVLFLLHHQDDDYPDRFYQMKKKMAVFGFGRQGIDKFIETVPQSFSIGFLETTDHSLISRIMQNILKEDVKHFATER